MRCTEKGVENVTNAGLFCKLYIKGRAKSFDKQVTEGQLWRKTAYRGPIGCTFVPDISHTMTSV